DALLPQNCQQRAVRSTISFFADGMSCGGTIALARLDMAYEIRVNWLTGRSRLYPVQRAPTDRSDAGFTILEVLVALAVVAVSIVAFGSVMSTNIRGVKALENHVALMQGAQAVLATAIPPRKELVPGALSGQVGDFLWRVDIGPV